MAASVVEDNDLTGNMEGEWVIEDDSGADATRVPRNYLRFVQSLDFPGMPGSASSS